MVNHKQFIEVHGKERGLLFTPSLYIGIKEKGWKIEIDPNTTDLTEIWSAYVKLFYAAAWNYHRVEKFDNPSLPEFDLNLADMEIWAAIHKEEVARLIEVYVECMTEKTLKELATEIHEKKKKKSLWLAITSRLRRSELVSAVIRQDKRQRLPIKSTCISLGRKKKEP